MLRPCSWPALFIFFFSTYDICEKRRLLIVRGLQFIPPQQFVGIKIENDNGGMGDLIWAPQNVGQACVHDPKSVARVDPNPECGNYLIFREFFFFLWEKIGFPRGVGRQGCCFVCWVEVDVVEGRGNSSLPSEKKMLVCQELHFI